MRLTLAYWGVVLIWSTTPLAIKWSALEVSYIFGVTARMLIGAFCLLIMMAATRQRLSWRKPAIMTYVAVALQIYASMLLTYWGAQHIPSGWLSVIYGLSPFMTALMAAVALKERSLGWGKVLSYLLGTGGLIVMFSSALEFSDTAVKGMLALLLATFLHAASAIWVKRLDAGLPALSQISGGLFLALPCYLLTWYGLDHGHLPSTLSVQTWGSILYLGMIATPIGFALYYFVLARMPATNVAMINLLTPMFSLILGHQANQEPVTIKVFTGTTLILLALALHAYFDKPNHLAESHGRWLPKNPSNAKGKRKNKRR